MLKKVFFLIIDTILILLLLDKWTEIPKLGRVYLAPITFRGAKKFYQKKYADAMAICREFGDPHLLITFTGNSDWPELKRMQRPNEKYVDRPDLCCRLYKDKLEEFKRDLFVREVMGPVKAAFSSMEHQKG
jgi:hypothetical protein